jgi:hypothetical protein
MDDVLGTLDVTIIGWGQNHLNLSSKVGHTSMYNRWWYVIPHLGTDFGETCAAIFGEPLEETLPDGWVKAQTLDGGFSILDSVACPGGEGGKSGIMRFNRRFDDSGIESQAVGAVPFNFRPGPAPIPKRTGKPGPAP